MRGYSLSLWKGHREKSSNDATFVYAARFVPRLWLYTFGERFGPRRWCNLRTPLFDLECSRTTSPAVFGVLVLVRYREVIGRAESVRARYSSFRPKRRVEESDCLQVVRGFATLLPTECNVIRDGIEQKIQPANIVLGDIVVVRNGGKVPADLRLIVSLMT